MHARLPSEIAACLMLGLVVGVSPARGQVPKKAAGQQAAGPSNITVMNVGDLSKKVIFTVPQNIQAPNWSPDGSYLLLNGGGRLWKMPSEGGEPQVVDTGPIKGINNDHGISPDGKTLAISAGNIFLVPAAGGQPLKATSQIPSYYHGWSPDGKTLAYCAKRGENFDLYAIATEGGEERRLTSHVGYDDGPDYSPDGRWIYFNSDRSGSWDIWRIPADGAGKDDTRAERVTSDDYEDWFPHPSPDGKWMVIVSFKKGTTGHPAGQDVVLRLMPMPGDKLAPAEIREIDHFYGGQGTINVNSWSPDSKRFAYVTYVAPTVKTP